MIEPGDTVLVPGSTLYLPIQAAGGLFSTGDGEISTMAIECPIERVDLTFSLHPDMRLTTPRAHTPDGWLTFGIHADLNIACKTAVDAMLELMQELYRLSPMDALLLGTAVVDVRIAQMVLDSAKAAYAVLPHDAIRFG